MVTLMDRIRSRRTAARRADAIQRALRVHRVGTEHDKPGQRTAR